MFANRIWFFIHTNVPIKSLIILTFKKLSGILIHLGIRECYFEVRKSKCHGKSDLYAVKYFLMNT